MPPVQTPGAPGALPPSFVEARALLTEISRQRRNSLFSASAGLGFDELASRQYVETTATREACAKLLRRQGPVVIEGAPGSGKTTLLRLLAYVGLTAMREPVHFLETQSSFGRIEAKVAAEAPGLLIMDNCQRNFVFANEVLAARKTKLTVAAAHPPDYSTTWGRQAWSFAGFHVNVYAHQVVDEVLERDIEPLMDPEAFRATRGKLRHSRVDLWTLTWAHDACVEHVRRFHALTDDDVLRLARDRAVEWLRRGLPGQLGVKEVSSALLPVSVFSAYEIPVPREFLETNYRVDATAFSKLVAYGEIAVVGEQVALHHRTLARLYASAIRGAPDLAALADPALLNDDVAPAFAALAASHPEAMLDAVARFSSAAGEASAQALVETPQVRRALLLALGDTEVVRRALPAIGRIAADAQRLIVRLPNDVLRAMCAGAVRMLETEDGSSRLSAASAAGLLARWLERGERTQVGRRLAAAVIEANWGQPSVVFQAFRHVYAASPNPEREAFADTLIDAGENGTAPNRGRALRALGDLGAATPVSRWRALFNAALAGLASDDEDILRSAGAPFVWAAGLVPRGEMDGIASRLIEMLPTGSVDAQDERLEALREIRGYCSGQMLDRIIAAHLDIGHSRAPANLFFVSSFLEQIARANRMPPERVNEAVELTLRYSHHPREADEDSDSEGPFAARCAADDLGAYAGLLTRDMRAKVIPRLVAFLEDPVEFYKWGEDAMSSAAESLGKYSQYLEPAEVEWCARQYLRLFSSARERVRLVAVACAGSLVHLASPETRMELLSALFIELEDESDDPRETAGQVIASWVPKMYPRELEALGRALESFLRGQSKWQRTDAVAVSIGAIPYLPAHLRGAAMTLVCDDVNLEDWQNREPAILLLSKVADTADAPLFSFIARGILPALRTKEVNIWVHAARFILKNRTRLEPAPVRAALDMMLESSAGREPWRAGTLAAEVAADRDPTLAPFLEAIAVNLALSRNGFAMGKAAEIARSLPARGLASPPSHLPAAISVSLNAGEPIARAHAARLLLEYPSFKEQGQSDDPLGTLREVLISALSTMKRHRPGTYDRWDEVLKAAGEVVPQELAEEMYCAMEEMALSASGEVREAAVKGLQEFAASLTTELKARAAMLLVRVVASEDCDASRSALRALELYVGAIDPGRRAEAICLVLDAPTRFVRWTTKEKLTVLYALRDAVPEERKDEVDAQIGGWKPKEAAPPSLLQ